MSSPWSRGRGPFGPFTIGGRGGNPDRLGPPLVVEGGPRPTRCGRSAGTITFPAWPARLTGRSTFNQGTCRIPRGGPLETSPWDRIRFSKRASTALKASHRAAGLRPPPTEGACHPMPVGPGSRRPPPSHPRWDMDAFLCVRGGPPNRSRARPGVRRRGRRSRRPRGLSRSPVPSAPARCHSAHAHRTARARPLPHSAFPACPTCQFRAVLARARISWRWLARVSPR